MRPGFFGGPDPASWESRLARKNQAEAGNETGQAAGGRGVGDITRITYISNAMRLRCQIGGARMFIKQSYERAKNIDSALYKHRKAPLIVF
jgi:hypothetical protein